ncbi:MAG: hypothetical protein EBY65_10110, partial [Acidimicrobiia bacterium]|nr:hypothetical protein [Acidimicrobiia bacterium]
KFGLSREDLKGHMESYASQADKNRRDYMSEKKRGQTNDLICYWEIYSKTGFGDRMKNADKDLRGKFDAMGPNCYIVVAEGVEFPLNLPPKMLQEEVDETGMLRSRPGWWVAGEMLAWDAPTGGYLIQACLSTGHRAGVAAARWAAEHP